MEPVFMYWNKLKFDGQSNLKEFKATMEII